MKNYINIAIVIIASLTMMSCFNKKTPNYQYMPNMYESVGYETYGEYEILPNSQEAMLPAEGTIPRGWKPYEYENSNEGKTLATTDLKNPLAVTEDNLDEGKKLFTIYCAVCHGKKGDGKGILVERDKFLGVPSYDDAGRTITEGSIYHVQMYGINAMGSHASQTNEEERWQITMYVQNLMATLKGEPLLTLTVEDDMSMEVSEEMTEITNETVEDSTSEEQH